MVVGGHGAISRYSPHLALRASAHHPTRRLPTARKAITARDPLRSFAMNEAADDTSSGSPS